MPNTEPSTCYRARCLRNLVPAGGIAGTVAAVFAFLFPWSVGASRRVAFCVQQCESALCLRVPLLGLPACLGPTGPWVAFSEPRSRFSPVTCFICSGVCVLTLISSPAHLPLPPLGSMCLFSDSLSLFLLCMCVHLYHFYRCHICVCVCVLIYGICFSF